MKPVPAASAGHSRRSFLQTALAGGAAATGAYFGIIPRANAAGPIVIDGQDATDLPAARRRLAMVFQSYALYPHMSVRENLCLGQQKVLGRSRDEANAKLAQNAGMIASFSRALTEGLTAQQSDEEFNATLDAAITNIAKASNT